MSFEEQYPSMKGKIEWAYNRYWKLAESIKVSVQTNRPLSDIDFIKDIKRDIQECLLDKAKVREAFEEFGKINNSTIKRFDSSEECQRWGTAWNKLIKELGLE